MFDCLRILGVFVIVIGLDTSSGKHLEVHDLVSREDHMLPVNFSDRNGHE